MCIRDRSTLQTDDVEMTPELKALKSSYLRTVKEKIRSFWRYDDAKKSWFCDVLINQADNGACLLYTSPSPRDRQKSRMPSSA